MADWEANVRRVVPYTPGEQPKRNDIIKLNTNECPYPPAPGVTKALQEFEADKLRLYPDPAALELREAIAAAVFCSGTSGSGRPGVCGRRLRRCAGAGISDLL